MTFPKPEKGTKSSRLNASSIATLAPGDHTDPATQGLQLRVRAGAKGKTTRAWLFRFTWEGEWVRITLGHFPGTSLVEARERAKELRKGIDSGIDPRRTKERRRAMPSPLPGGAAVSAASARFTVEHLASDYLQRFVATRGNPNYKRRLLDVDVLPIWAGRDARTIDLDDVHKVLDPILDRGAKIMANRTARVLGQMFKWAMHRGIVKTSPVQLMFAPGGKETPRQRTLTEAELTAFFVNRHRVTHYTRLTHVIPVLLLTGVRRSELALADWNQIDFEEKIWIVPRENTKTKREDNVVPLSDFAVRELRALERLSRGSAFVIPNPKGTRPLPADYLTDSMKACEQRHRGWGIASFTLHDLRRTCRTNLGRLGVETHIAERVMSHVQDKIIATYDTHPYLDEKRAALNKWAAYLEKLSPVTQ